MDSHPVLVTKMSWSQVLSWYSISFFFTSFIFGYSRWPHVINDHWSLIIEAPPVFFMYKIYMFRLGRGALLMPLPTALGRSVSLVCRFRLLADRFPHLDSRKQQFLSVYVWRSAGYSFEDFIFAAGRQITEIDFLFIQKFQWLK